MKRRESRGEPRLPRKLYCPVGPAVRLKFWKLLGSVSTSVGVMLPNRLSMFQAYEPMGMIF